VCSLSLSLLLFKTMSVFHGSWIMVLFVMTTQVQRYLEELFMDESKVWECARQTHIQQSSRFSNFSQAVELFKSDSFKDQ